MGEDRILLEGMIFYGYHGALQAERELGQRFVVDVELHCDLRPAGTSDELSKTVDYSEIYRQAREVAEGEPLNLVETVAERIAASVIERHHPVQAIRVKVAKPEVRLEDTVLKGAAVEVLRRRETL